MSVSFSSELLPPRLTSSLLHSTRRGNRAVGVEYVDDNVGRLQNGTQKKFFVKASRMVIVSAGAFGSPAILERCVQVLQISINLAHSVCFVGRVSAELMYCRGMMLIKLLISQG